MTTTIHLAFGEVHDPRAQNRSYPLIDLLFLTICAMVAGAEDFDEVVDWARLHREFLREFLDDFGPVPTPGTLRRVFSLLDSEALEKGFARWAQATAPKPKGKRILAADGKSLRGSFKTDERTDMFHSVALMCHESGMMLALNGTYGKGHEIADLRRLLQVMDLRDTLITADALHTTSETVRLIVEAKGDYLLPLKDNCSATLAQAQLLFESAQREGDELGYRYEQTDSGHGRVEVRRGWSAPVSPRWFGSDSKQWAGVKSVVRLERERHLKGETSVEVIYMLSSLEAQHVELMCQAARGHWAIENRGHWVLDVILKEDSSRLRAKRAARNLAVVRRMVLNLLRQDLSQNCSLKRKRFRASMDQDILERLIRPLTNIPHPRS
jgi:predicted transposase YbfD/YdcC